MEKTPNQEEKNISLECVIQQTSSCSLDKKKSTWLSETSLAAFRRNSLFFVHLLSWIIFFLISTFNLYEYVLRVSPSVMSSEVMSSFHINATTFGRLSACFYLIYAPMQIWVGVLTDRYGPRYLLPTAALICALGTFLFAGAQSVWVAQLARILMGFGSAFAFIGGLKFIMIRFAPRRFGFLLGLMVSFCLLGGILGQVFLASLLKRWDWRTICYGIAVLGVVLSFLTAYSMHIQKTVVSLEEKTASSGWIFIFSSLQDLLKNPRVWLIAGVGCLFYLPTSVFAELWGISYLKVGYGFSSIQAAYVVSMMFLGWAVGCPLMGWVSDYFKQPRILIVLGAFFSFVLLFVMLMIPTALISYLSWFMFGLGFFGSTQMQVTSLIRQQVALENASTAIAFLNMFVLMGGFLFQPLIGLLLDKFWHGSLIDGVRFYSGSDYQTALLVLPIALLVGIFLCLFFWGGNAAPHKK